MMMNSVLTKPSKYLRAQPVSGGTPKVDREGGYKKAGVIRGVSVVTEGEALGHGIWLDATFLEQVDDAINASSKGVKSRFTHPSMSGDGLGKFVGRIMDSELSGSKVMADQHFSEAGHRTPDGDLAGYLMDLADEDPESYGLSIVFMLDIGEMDRFKAANEDADGHFLSPDANNKNNYEHARLSQLRAVDAVDEPAANPDGLFRRDDQIVDEAEAVASYSLGLTEQQPASVALGLDPERVRGFVARFLSTHNLEIVAMADEAKTETTEEETKLLEDETAQGSQLENGSDTASASENAEPEDAVGNEKTGLDYQAAFGDKGCVWFVEGKSFDESQTLYNEAKDAEIEELKQKLSVRDAAAGEDGPIDFSSDEDDNAKSKGFAGRIRIK